MKTLIATMLTIFFACGVVGCNTTRGIGQDVEAAGEGLEEVAEETEEELED
jgi:predicted small secreted protein